MLESVVFLAFFLGVPILAALLMGWMGVQALRERAALRRAVSAWTVDPALLEVARQIPTVPERATLSDGVSREIDGERVLVGRIRWNGRSPDPELRQGGHLKLLAFRRPTPGLDGVIQRRRGGMVEDALIKMIGDRARADLGPAWAWAIVSTDGSGAWLSDSVAAALDGCVGVQERVYFVGEWVLFSAADPMSEVLETAEARVRQLKSALTRR